MIETTEPEKMALTSMDIAEEKHRFQEWSAQVADRFGYVVEYGAIGELDAVVGPPTQMAIFSRVA